MTPNKNEHMWFFWVQPPTFVHQHNGLMHTDCTLKHFPIISQYVGAEFICAVQPILKERCTSELEEAWKVRRFWLDAWRDGLDVCNWRTWARWVKCSSKCPCVIRTDSIECFLKGWSKCIWKYENVSWDSVVLWEKKKPQTIIILTTITCLYCHLVVNWEQCEIVDAEALMKAWLNVYNWLRKEGN